MAWRYHGKTFIKAEAKDIYPLISTAEGFTKWFLRKCELDLTPGGELKFTWANDVSAKAKFIEMEQNKCFSFAWNFSIIESGTRIDLWLEPVDGGTIFHIEEGDYPEDTKSAKMYQEITQGWTEFVFNMKAVVQYRTDLRDEWT